MYEFTNQCCGHCCGYYLIPCHVVESLQPIWRSSTRREIYENPISKWVAVTWIIGHQVSSPSDGHQGDIPCCMLVSIYALYVEWVRDMYNVHASWFVFDGKCLVVWYSYRFPLFCYPLPCSSQWYPGLGLHRATGIALHVIRASGNMLRAAGNIYGGC